MANEPRICFFLLIQFFLLKNGKLYIFISIYREICVCGGGGVHKIYLNFTKNYDISEILKHRLATSWH